MGRKMKTDKSDLDMYWLKSLELPVEFSQTETEQSMLSFSIDIETAKNMASGTCILPSNSRDFVICKEEEKIKIFKIIRKKEAVKSIYVALPTGQ